MYSRNMNQGIPTDLFLGKLPLTIIPTSKILVLGLIRENHLQEYYYDNFLIKMKSMLVDHVMM